MLITNAGRGYGFRLSPAQALLRIGAKSSGFGTSPGYVYVPVGFSVIYIQNAKFGSGGMGGFVTPNGGNGGPGNRATF
jgi:hypothetical protein